jgi:uncharacterized protein (TIGR03067 family)
VTSVEEDGKKIFFSNWRVTVTDDVLIVRDEDLAVNPLEASYKLDSSATPKRIELTIVKTGETLKGIYRIEQGVMTIVYNDKPSDPFPTRFISGPGNDKSPNNHLLQMKRNQ